ncbi:metalloendopeptidase [Elstera cyanobacteriorum]|uniref:M48 family metallopeptidase n=1 Tax=Elstera cyanobacteriorum TaxID=2022747 RepID=UPI00114024C0|nr:M48 family metallopeptidase [Elstera cyanobacteriorum]GFZ95322.1 metalloendopeptidase [Elstera cyanobacteriorum]
MRSISVPDPRATGRYSDGVTAAQRAVTLSVEGDGLILATDTGPLTRWPCAAIRLRDGAQQTARAGVAVLIHEAEQVRLTALTDLDALRPFLPQLTAPTSKQRQERRATVRWLGGIVAGLAALYFLLPPLAAWGAALIPLSWQAHLGDETETAIVKALAQKPMPPAACADTQDTPVLARVAEALATAADLPAPPQIRVYPVALPNAFALPGNRIILTRGLLKRLQTPEQVLAVLAHEAAHLAHADPLAAVIQHMGWSLAAQTLFGIGTVASLAEIMPILAYHRDIERRADRDGARYLLALGRAPTLLGEALQRLPETEMAFVPQWFSTHPDTAERVAALAELPKPGLATIGFTYSPADVTALRKACGV